MARDPFETATEDVYRDGDVVQPDPDALRERPAPAEVELGRDGELPDTQPVQPVTITRREDARTHDPAVDRSTGDATAFDADPEGTRFRDGGTFSNEPGWFAPGPKNAQLCYWMNLGGFVFWFAPPIAALIALVNRNKVGPELRTHYTYAAMTFGLALLYGLIATALIPPNYLGFVTLALAGWYGWRNLRGLARLGSGEPMPDPKTWTV